MKWGMIGNLSVRGCVVYKFRLSEGAVSKLVDVRAGCWTAAASSKEANKTLFWLHPVVG